MIKYSPDIELHTIILSDGLGGKGETYIRKEDGFFYKDGDDSVPLKWNDFTIEGTPNGELTLK